MNPLDEIEMEMGGKSMKVGDRVKTIDGKEGCVYRLESDGRLWVDVGGTWAGDYLRWQLTPLPESEIEKYRKLNAWDDCTQRQHWNCVDICSGCACYRKPDHSYASRLSLITYPEPLFICSKAGECKEDCTHNGKHKWQGRDTFDGCEGNGCDERDIEATCIPYVPEDEAREWFVMAMPRSENAGWMLGTLMTKDQAEKALAGWCLRPDCDYRILRWSDGLKGGE
ncbi:MAG: hypothetical protein WC455_18875 [Dehalococcoidia bacterium]|jgi:hypothetical protein